MITINCDGACEPVNPGGVPAWGFVVYHDGRWIHEAHGIYSHAGTSNQAEYAALLEALKFLAGCGMTREKVQVLTDSRLLVNQMTGWWGVWSDNLIGLYNDVKVVEREFRRVSYRWIPRQDNEYADMLSRMSYAEVDTGSGWSPQTS
jgi:ribonuclease HI